MAVPIFAASVKNGELIFSQRPLLTRYLYSLEDKAVEVIIRKERNDRSLKQNAYYWSCVVRLLSDHTGFELDEMHEALKIKFLSDEAADKHGLLKVRSTTTLTTDEFIQYVNRIVRWAAQELGVFIPDPAHAEV